MKVSWSNQLTSKVTPDRCVGSEYGRLIMDPNRYPGPNLLEPEDITLYGKRDLQM